MEPKKNLKNDFDSQLRSFENFHIVLWLIKDMCWCMLWKPLAIAMILPTLAFAVYITYKSRAFKAELYHNLAVIMWILANSIWMLGEFYFNDRSKYLALIFFIFGFVFIGYYYITRYFGKKS